LFSSLFTLIPAHSDKAVEKWGRECGLEERQPFGCLVKRAVAGEEGEDRVGDGRKREKVEVIKQLEPREENVSDLRLSSSRVHGKSAGGAAFRNT